MKKVLSFLACYIISFALLLVSGYGNLMNDISESLAVKTFFATTLVLSIILMIIWEMFIYFKNEITERSQRIEDLETENNRIKNKEE